MTKNAVRDLLDPSPEPTLANSISDRMSQEVIVAFVGPVGSGVSTAAEYVRDLLVQDFGYSVPKTIKPSDIIKAEAHRVGITDIPSSPLDQYVDRMQTAGNALRKRFGGDYLAEKAIERIHTFRIEQQGVTASGEILPGRRAYIIDSLKNPEELELLRRIYGETLCVIGVFAPDAVRLNRLKDDGGQAGSLGRIVARDRGEVPTFGQKTRKLFVKADFFVCNDGKKEDLRIKLSRFLNIVFDTAIHTPTRAESAMYKASSAAVNSGCMSRQVGAAIVSERGELIGIGWNDVPRYGGGLYCEDDQFVITEKGIEDHDCRCFKWGGRVCHNETRRNAIVEKIIKRIAGSEIIKKGKGENEVRELLGGTEIEYLIEYSRSIHAEMEAILSVAREGRHSLVNATLYTNTYPCHNCARHIVAAGICSVVYIEPYDKSLAIELHNDAVTENPEDKKRVVFRQYDGVAPSRYLRLFRAQSDRKTDGHKAPRDPKNASPIFQIPLDSPALWESKVIADLTDKEQNPV